MTIHGTKHDNVEDKPFGFAMLKTVLQWMDKH
jgi:hypothetical protein